MFGFDFQHENIRKSVVLFGTLFDDIYISRVDGTKFKVPLSYGPQEKFLARIKQDPFTDRETAITLPRMGFEIDTVTYDASRKTPTLVKNAINSGENNSMVTQYNSVPYNIGFELTVYGKTAEDTTKIVEQILPFFTPQWVVKAKVNEEFGDISYNIPVVLNSVNQLDSYDDAFTERRAVVWTLKFTMKTNFFGPVSSSKIIKFANISITVPFRQDVDFANNAALAELNPTENIYLQPGLTANGEPTHIVSESISPLDINKDDDWTYAYEITTVDDFG